MSRYSPSIDPVLAAIKYHRETLQDLQKVLVTYAKNQAYLEDKYDELLSITRSGIDLLKRLEVGSRIDRAWITERDTLVNRAVTFIADVEEGMIVP